MDEFEDSEILGYTVEHTEASWTQIFLRVPELKPFGEAQDIIEKIEDIHIEATKNFIVLMRRNGTTETIPISEILLHPSESPSAIRSSPVKLPITQFYENKYDVDEIGLKWMYVDDLI